MEGDQWGAGMRRMGGSGENGGKDTGNKKHNWQVQNRQGKVKNSMGKGEAKEVGLKEAHTKAHHYPRLKIRRES